MALAAVAAICAGMVLSNKGGNWPDSWPRELEPLRSQSTTIDVAHGIQETLYEIPFSSRAEFEKAWPFILKLKSKGAPLVLDKAPSTYSTSGSTLAVGVRILVPSGAVLQAPTSTTRLTAAAPWPDSIKTASGDLPEYVVAENGRWIAYIGQEAHGFIYRARTDITLVVDGQIVDLNRIEFPPQTTLMDRRFRR